MPNEPDRPPTHSEPTTLLNEAFARFVGGAAVTYLPHQFRLRHLAAWANPHKLIPELDIDQRDRAGFDKWKDLVTHLEKEHQRQLAGAIGRPPADEIITVGYLRYLAQARPESIQELRNTGPVRSKFLITAFASQLRAPLERAIAEGRALTPLEALQEKTGFNLVHIDYREFEKEIEFLLGKRRVIEVDIDEMTDWIRPDSNLDPIYTTGYSGPAGVIFDQAGRFKVFHSVVPVTSGDLPAYEGAVTGVYGLAPAWVDSDPLRVLSSWLARLEPDSRVGPPDSLENPAQYRPLRILVHPPLKTVLYTFSPGERPPNPNE